MVIAILDGPFQVRTTKANRLLGNHAAKEMPALINGLLPFWQRENLVIDSGKGLDRMSKRINAAIRSHFLGASGGKIRLHNRNAGSKIIAQATKLQLCGRICKHIRP